MSAPAVTRFARLAANATWRDVDWARARLQPHAGKTIRVEFWPLGFAGFTLQVSPDGEWVDAPATSEQQADATLRMTPAMLPRLATALATAPSTALANPGAAIDFDGEPALVETLRELIEVLPLALEERLATLIGPIPAHGLATAMRELASWPGYAAGRIGAGLAAYLSEETATLLKRRTFDEFGKEVTALRERAERLGGSA